MFVIINADDLGASAKVNDAIFELMESRLATSATLLANGPYLKDASKRLLNFPECSFGVHLNITQFRPLVYSDELKVLLDKDGCFSSSKKISKIKITSSLSYAIYREFSAQVEKLLSLGIKISHIDSHYHIHTAIPMIFPILKRIQKKYGLRKVRISKNIYPYDYKVPKKRLLKKRVYNFILRHYYQTKTTSGFTNFITFYENGKLKKLGRHKTIEVVIHPGGAGSYEDETTLLKSSWQGLLPFTIDLISYYQL